MNRSIAGSIRRVCITAGVLLATGCTLLPTSHEWSGDEELLYSWNLLDIYFIFRDSLPADPWSYDTPRELYRSLNERYTAYYPPEEAPAFLSSLTTTQGGIGIMIDSVGGGYCIDLVVADSPGERAGLRAGDTITAVNGTGIGALPYEETLALIRGDIGDVRELALKRDTLSLTVPVTLGTFLAPSVYVDSVDSQTALITLRVFLDSTGVAGGSTAEFADALDTTRWAAHTIIDLRNNLGGMVTHCMNIISQFVPAGTEVIRSRERIYDQKGDSGRTVVEVWTTDSSFGGGRDRPFTILVDSLTASASEVMVSCLMRARPDITVVGTRTLGKARGQILFESPLGGIAKITYTLLEPVEGEPYDLTGITPDVTVERSRDAYDVALDLIADTTGQGTAKRPALAAARQQRIRTLEYRRLADLALPSALRGPATR